MQRCLILFLLICFCNRVKGQETDDVKSVMRAVSYSLNGNYTICTDNADFPASLIKQVNIYLEKDSILRLSPDEKKELQNKLLAAQHAPKWQGNTVSDIPVIKSNTVKKVMGDSAKMWEYFKM